MANPKYIKVPVWDVESEQWLTEIPKTTVDIYGKGIAGKEVRVILDPDAEFTIDYQEWNPETQVMETKQKTNFMEEHVYFIPDIGADGQPTDIAEWLSAAAWNHLNGLRKTTADPGMPPAATPVTAMDESAIDESLLAS